MIFDTSGLSLPVTDDCRNAAEVMVESIRVHADYPLLAPSAWDDLSRECAELLSQLTLGYRYLLQQAGGTLIVEPSPRIRIQVGGNCQYRLTGLLERVTSDWVAGIRLMLTRLKRDYEQLALLTDIRGALVSSIAGPLGEYSEGQTVRKIGFSSGRAVAYKPRPVDRDMWWFELTIWLRQCGAAELFTPLTIDSDGYGWSRWVDAAEVDGVVGLKEFYRRSGQLLFWLWATNSCDAVASNVIAAGNRPYLIDCETVLYPLHSRQSTDLAVTGLIPRPEGPSRNIARTGLALSRCPHHWTRRCFSNNKGDLTIDRALVPYDSSSHMPKLEGTTVPASDYLTEVQAGFAEAYDNATGARNRLVGASSPIMRRPAMRGRLIARSTLIYGELLTGYVSSGASEKWLSEALSLLDQPKKTSSPIPLQNLRTFEEYHLKRFSIPKVYFLDARTKRIQVPAIDIGHAELTSFDPLRRLLELTDAGRDRLLQEIKNALE